MSDIYTEGREKRKRRRVVFLFFAIFVCLYLLFLGGSWIVIRSPFFHLQKFTVVGNEKVSANDILGLLRARVLQGKWRPLKALLGLQNTLIWPEKLSKDDLIFIPQLKSVTLMRNYKERAIVVTVEERKPFGIWCATENGVDPGFSRCWWFDDEGVIFQNAVSAEGSLIMTVHDYSQKNLGLNSNILPQGFAHNMLSIFKVLAASGLNIKEIKLNDLALEEIEVLTYDGPKLYFSLRFPALNDLAAIQNIASRPGFNKLQYLDFRVENRVYYR